MSTQLPKTIHSFNKILEVCQEHHWGPTNVGL